MARVQRNHFVSLWNWKTQKQSESMLRDNIFLHASLLQGKHFNTKKNSSLGWRVGGGEDEEMHSSWTEMCFYGPITGLSVILTEASKQTCQPSYEKWELPRPCLHLSFLSSQPKSAFATLVVHTECRFSRSRNVVHDNTATWIQIFSSSVWPVFTQEHKVLHTDMRANWVNELQYD